MAVIVLDRGIGVMLFNVTLNNISVMSLRSVLLMEETRENHRPAASHWQTLSHNVVPSTPHLSGIPTHNVNNSLGKNMFTNIEIDYRGKWLNVVWIWFSE